MVPPALAWVDDFTHWIVGALGSSVKYTIKSTVNPLVFRIDILFAERISGRNLMLVWNLFQMYAVANDNVPKGKTSGNDRSLTAEVIIKRRFGPIKNKSPMEKR